MSACALAAIGTCVALPAAAQAAPGARFGESTAIPPVSAGRARDVPGLAVNPADPNHIVEAEIDPINGNCDYHVSFDGGRTWAGGHLTVSNTIPTFPAPACDQNFDSGGYAHFNTGIAFGSGQNVYVTFSIHRGPFNRPESNADGGNGDDAVVARSTDGGRTFAPATIAVPGGGPTATSPGLAGFGMRPQIAVQRGAGAGGSDRLFVASWNCFIRVRASQTARGGCSGGGGDRRIFVTRSNDGGLTWAAPVQASAANVRAGTVTPPTGAAGEAGSLDEQAVEPSQPVIGPNGAIYVAYKNRDITDGTTCPANPNITPPAPGGFNNTLAFCIVVARSTDGGATFQQFNTGIPMPTGNLRNPRLAIDPTTSATGTLYVVYQRGVGTDPSEIHIQSSADGAVTWTNPAVKVNSDPLGTGAAATQTNPFVSVGPGGRVDVVWGDKRNTYPGPGDYGDTYMASSTDHAATFGPDRRIDDRTVNFNVGRAGDTGSALGPGFSWFGPVSLPLANGAVLGAWLDSRVGSADSALQDIFLGRLDPAAEIGINPITTATPGGLSVRLSRLAYPGGSDASGPDPVSRVVVVNQDDPAAALAGSVLARANFGPLLLSPAAGLPAIVKAEAARMRPTGAYVIGDSSALPPSVTSDLRDVTRNNENVVRISAPAGVAANNRAADIARQVGELLHPLSSAPTEALIANPSTPEASAAAALAASKRLPILFVDGRTTVPPPTSAAIAALGITKLTIVGGTQSVNAGVAAALAALPGVATVVRLDGANANATSRLALQESIARGTPSNVVYAADPARPTEAAALAAAVGRVTGLMLLEPSASGAAAQTDLTNLGVAAAVDRIVPALGIGGTDPTLPLGAVSPPAGLPTTQPVVTPAATMPRVAVSGLKISPSSFRPARSGSSVRAGSSRGATVSYRLNIAGVVRFSVERKTTGRRVGGRCVATTSSNRGRASCVRYVRLSGSFSRTRKAGSDRFRFTGRLSGRALRASSYRLVASPRANGQRGVTKRAAFRTK